MSNLDVHFQFAVCVESLAASGDIAGDCWLRMNLQMASQV